MHHFLELLWSFKSYSQYTYLYKDKFHKNNETEIG